MSKKNNLKDYLKDLYQGISSKKPGASRNPQDFRAEIESIQGGGVSLEEFDGICKVTGTPTEEDHAETLYEYDGACKVSGEVSNELPSGYVNPEGELKITENGIYPVTDKESVWVDVPSRGGADPWDKDYDVTGEPTEGGDEGYDEGYTVGYATGYNEGYSNGSSEGHANGYSEGYGKGNLDGKAEGYADGHTTGYDEGYDEGYTKGNTDGHATGYNEGHTVGYSQCTEDMQDDLQTKYDEGYAAGETVGYTKGVDAVKTDESATQATPSITVSSNGLITASATQTEGYVSAGTKSATKQLTTQAEKTITPNTSNQTAVASGIYTTGTVTVEGDSNLIAANIKKDTTIFGVTGTYDNYSSGYDEGYSAGETAGYADGVAAQPTPTITVGDDGLITASAGEKSATKQLTTQAAKTIAPSTSAQTAIAAGTYATGAVTVAGDANLKAANIVKGATIFGVTGTAPSYDDGYNSALSMFQGKFMDWNATYSAWTCTFTATNYNAIYSLKLEIILSSLAEDVGSLTLVIDPNDSASAEIEGNAEDDWEVYIKSAEFF